MLGEKKRYSPVRNTVLALTLVASGALVGACVGEKTSEPPVLPTSTASSQPLDTNLPPTRVIDQPAQYYNGSVRELAGRPLIDEQRYQRLKNKLLTSPSPLFIAAGRHLEIMRAGGKPAGLPSWLAAESFPLVITNSDTRVSLSAEQLEWGEPFLYQTNPAKPATTGKAISRVFGALHLDASPLLRENGEVAEAAYLAKEDLTFLLGLGMARETYGLLPAMGVTVSEVNGQPITDPNRAEIVGAALFFNTISNRETDMWQIRDGLPILLVASQLGPYFANSELPTTARGIGPLYLAWNMLHDPQNIALKQAVDGVAVNWANSGQLLPPVGTTQLAFSEPIASGVKAIQNQIKQLDGP